MGRYALIGGLVACAIGAPVAGCGTNGGSAAKSTASGNGSTQSPSKVLPNGAVRIERNAHPIARPELDLGPVDPSTRMSQLSIAFKPTAAQTRDLEQLKKDLQNPGSPSYHKWLTPEDYAARFGANPADVARVRKWLGDQGLEVGATSRLNSRVTFAGSAGKVGAAFQTEYHHYKVGNETHFAMSKAPAVPAEFADLILDIHNTHDLRKRPLAQPAHPIPESTCPGGTVKSYCAGPGIAPPDWASIYDVSKLYTTGVGGKALDGTGVTIAIVGTAEIAQTDIDQFHKSWPASGVIGGKLPPPLVMTLVPDSGVAQSGSNGTGTEAILDTEWASGLAPNATVNYVFVGNDPNSYVDGAVFWAIENNLGSILSESWGGCEGTGPAADSDLEQVYGSAASVMGITYLAASGDDGAALCLNQNQNGIYVGVPAAYPEVTAVGGTEFPSGSLTYVGGIASGYSTLESVWNEGDNPMKRLAEGSGGVSTIFSRPVYQMGVPACTPVGSFPIAIDPTKMREVPDVSFSAASGSNAILIQCTYSASSGDCAAGGGSPIGLAIGGTSASTPAFAGAVALLAQATGTRLGNINPMLYALNTSTPTAFHDITTGNNEVACTVGTDPGCDPTTNLYGYAATKGYDCATGLGSVDVANLITTWSALLPTTTTLDAAPTSVSAGTPITLTANVGVTGTGTMALGGDVTFLFETYDLNGNFDETWELGTVPIAGGTITAGAATLSTVVPAGMAARPMPYADLVANYGGDATHLASQSTLARVTFASLGAFCISPNIASTTRGGNLSFVSFGGAAPVRWEIYGDTTYNPMYGTDGSTIDRNTGVLTAGTYGAGYTLVAAIDANGVEAYAEVTVDTPTDPTVEPWYGDAGFVSNACPASDDAGVIDSGPIDAGAPDEGPADTGVVDAGPIDTGAPDSGPIETGPIDSGAADAGAPTDAGATDAGAIDAGAPTTDGGHTDAGTTTTVVTGSGCSCTTTGRDTQSTTSALGGLALVLGVVARRRRSSKR